MYYRGKLCIIATESPTDMGGIATIVRDLVRLYSSSGYEVHLCIGVSARYIRGYTNVHTFGLLRRLFPEFLWPFNLLFVACLTIYLCYLHRRFRFDAFLPQDNYLLGLAATLAGRLVGCPSVVMDHGTAIVIADASWRLAWRERHPGIAGRLAAPLFRAGLAMQPFVFRTVCTLGDRFFFTGYELDEFYQHYGVPASKRYKYEHLIDDNFFSPAPNASVVTALRERFGLPRDHFVLSCTSRISPEKGYRQIVAAFGALVAAAGRDVTLAIAGDTGQMGQTRYRPDREKEAVIDYLISHDLIANVRFLGVLDAEHVRDLNRASDVHVYAGTMSCSFSLCVLEAMACALPCIVTPVPRKQADVITPDIGWVVPPGQAEPLAAAFVEAYRRRADLPRMGRRARQYVLEHDTYAAMRNTYEDAVTFSSPPTGPDAQMLRPEALR